MFLNVFLTQKVIDMAGNLNKTPEGVACYVWLDTPRPPNKDKNGVPMGEPKYGLALLFDDGEDLSGMEQAATQKLVEKFGPKAMDLVKKGKLNWPFKDTADLDDPAEPFDRPGIFVNFNTQNKPGVVDEDANPIMEKSEVYSGMRARVSYRCSAYDNVTKGVAFYLVNVQKLGDGPRYSGDPKAEDDFKSDAKKKKPVAPKTPIDEDDL